MPIYDDEIFGPVLSVVRVGSYDEGLKLINDNPTATARRSSPTTVARPGASRTRSRSAWSASTCRSRCPMAYFSFGGWKASLFGDSHAHGMEGVHFFTRGKVVTSRWLDPSHGGLNLGFPQNSAAVPAFRPWWTSSGPPTEPHRQRRMFP
jgi:malonate-semialdehyde dehydrogenase (acetylating)/methylmalonate-semialdehyde dehydrogenase